MTRYIKALMIGLRRTRGIHHIKSVQKMKKSNSETMWMGIFLGLALGFALALCYVGYNYEKKHNVVNDVKEIVINDSIEEETAKQLVYRIICELKISNPDIVMAQAILETGNFQSVLCLEYNNLFGMNMPTTRATTAINKTANGFAIYESWRDSIIDYALYQAYRWSSLSNYTDSAYIRHISKSYAEDTLYSQKVLSIHQKLITNQ
jgi:hypothetical protein